MSELGEYRRLIERPMIAGYEATIVSLRAELERSQDALQQLVDYIKDGCPDDGQYYVMTEAQAALKGIKVVQPASPLRGDHSALAVRLGHMSKWFTDQSYEATMLREAQAALASASPPEQPAAAPFQPHENCNCLMCLAEKSR